MACVALVAPNALIAQNVPGGLTQQLAAEAGLEMCDGDAPDAPCVSEDGFLVVQRPTDGLAACDAETPVPCVTTEGLVKVDVESEIGQQVLANRQSQPNAESEAAAGDQPAEEAAPVDVVTEEPAVTEGEAALQADTTAEADTAAQPQEGTADGTISTDTTADSAVPPTEEQANEGSTIEEDTGANVVEAPEATEEAPADEGAVAETEAEQPVEAETTAEAEPAPDVETETTAESEPAPDVETETTAEAEPTSEVEAEQPVAGGEMTATDTEPSVEAEGDVATSTEDPVESIDATEPEAPVEEIVEVEEAPSAAAAAADGTAEAPADVTVETEEVTEDTSRSSSEEFQTTATGDASAQAEVGGDDGLSNFEKALLIGLGAVAVGSILNNGDEVVSNSGDRIVLREPSGDLRVLKNDDALLRQPGSEVQTETFSDGSTRSTVTRDDGTQIVTIRAADGRVVRRARILPDGRQIVLFDDTTEFEPVRVTELPTIEKRATGIDANNADQLREALAAAEVNNLDRRFSLRQIRQIEQVRALAPEIDVNAVTFASGSAAILPNQAEELSELGNAMKDLIEESPGEVFLIEGHTDAVGDATYNLALSDRRAETLALALTEYFDVPPENMVTQGYGESQLRVQTESAERANRRATVRQITPLLGMAMN
ncbi:OmpA family protein [Silicimonas algicola]|nr:OmpA family protein [Silicimonas algicola]